MTKKRLELTWYNKDLALIPTTDGRYGYSWVHPTDPRYCEVRPLVMDDFVEGKQNPKEDKYVYSERADLTPQTDNLLIHGESGDVLEALTRVPELADKYAGRVKLIYIDPPFNTAQTFASYEDNLEHSVWLTMMRDRLLHMKKLLSEDGSIWIHLDYAENHRMRLLLDEVFGPQNFMAEVIWQKSDSPQNDANRFSTDQDVILVYRRSEHFKLHRLPRPATLNMRFTNPDNDPKGPWSKADPCAPDAPNHQPMVYAIQHPMTGELMYPSSGRCWSLASQTMFAEMSKWAEYTFKDINDRAQRAEISGIPVDRAPENVPAIMLAEPLESSAQKVRALIDSGDTLPELIFTKNGKGRIMRKSRIPKKGMVPRTLWLNDEVSHNRGAKKEIGALFPDTTAFSTPKPERLMERVLQIASVPGDIVLDVFAGSGTTAAVAQKMGRRWVTCELLESTFTTFTRPRLEKVVRGEDLGGITRTKGERVADEKSEIPESLSVEKAQEFVSTLNKFLAENPELKQSKDIKDLKRYAKTKPGKEVINWRGGGGFRVAHLAPACYTYDSDLERVMLTEDAYGETLRVSVVANLGFYELHPDDDYVFDGKRGKTLLKVHGGIATCELVDSLVSHLEEEEQLYLAATAVEDGVREYLRKVKKGSRVIIVPDDLFQTVHIEGE